MSAGLGLVLGVGVLLCASPLLWPGDSGASRLLSRLERGMRDRLAQAGLARVRLGVLAIVCLLAGASAAVLAAALLPIGMLALLAGAGAAFLPIAAISWRAAARRRAASLVWPDVVDHLVSALRSGMTLSEALAALGDTGPAVAREPFREFAREVQRTGDIGLAFDGVKARLADPVADRIVEALRMAREVGGAELTGVLRALAASLREEAALRAEVEARQSWVRNAARLGVAAPWVVLLLLASRPEAARLRVARRDRAARDRTRRLGRRVPPHDRARPSPRGTAVVRVSAAIAAGVPLGALLGLGLWSLLSLVPRLSRPRLVDRVAPQVADLSAEARELVQRLPADPTPLLGAVLAPLLRLGRVLLDRLLGGREGIERRLRQAGAESGAERLRSRQLLSGAAGAAAGTLLGAVALRSGAAGGSPLLALGAMLVGAGIGVMIPEQLLARRARQRLHRIGAEFPTVLELLTLALAAGESLSDAVRRVARTGSGELALELRRVVADANAGLPLATALEQMSDAIRLPELQRLVDQLLIALERGTPLVEVLRAQAQDSRDDAKRRLLEAAGRKEVVMLVPLVFLILPVTVAFAIFPGILVLELGF
ncbi:type II secretion system F family protein [Homoserinibacter sp. YIM 151385]|uniref:type II secretion system F family protein n=1 Tax=Homoserinibacter sp. YIM 151385 TaxID=2985506 RepID=UPI0022EFF841|nr:type II secretion system F family protein [Homoserinibacter sp. YIM 151385]WBU38195.1 type II secretion system F family protein [Homoserinibacter sp. YIM 151385]